jgi:uncharacterized membrane protein YdjX (TVP38/TMEM64 family)
MSAAWLRFAMIALRRLWPLLLLAALLAAAYASGLQRQLSWSALAAHEAALRQRVELHPLWAACAYVVTYAAAVAISLPAAVVLTVSGGLLFGTAGGGALAVAGAWIGAVLLFLAARTALGPLLATRAATLLDHVRPGLQRDGFSYLLALRLIPVVPFWLTNLAPALVGMSLAPYAAATLLGIIPATLVFASIGAGVANVLAAGGQPDLSVIFSAPVLLPLLGLALLSLAPVVWRLWQRRRLRGRHA